MQLLNALLLLEQLLLVLLLLLYNHVQKKLILQTQRTVPTGLIFPLSVRLVSRRRLSLMMISTVLGTCVRLLWCALRSREPPAMSRRTRPAW